MAVNDVEHCEIFEVHEDKVRKVTARMPEGHAFFGLFCIGTGFACGFN